MEASSYERQPIDWQERHSPTEAVEVEISKVPRRVTQTCRRRILDARLWDGLSHYQQNAALIIERGFSHATSDCRVKIQTLERVSPGGFDYDAGSRDERDYWQWAKEAQRERIDHSAIMDVLAFGKSLTETDRQRRKAQHYTRGHLIDGLNLFCRQKGWPIPDDGG